MNKPRQIAFALQDDVNQAKKNIGQALKAIKSNNQSELENLFYCQDYKPTIQSDDDLVALIIEALTYNDKLCQCVKCCNYLLWNDSQNPHETGCGYHKDGCQCDVVMCALIR